MERQLSHLWWRNNHHIHQIGWSFLETHLRSHIQAGIQFHSQCGWKRIWGGWKICRIVFLLKLSFLSPYPQVIFSGLHESRDIASISTESSHQWRVLWTAIPHFNVIWWCSLAIYIHGEEGDVDIGSIGLRDEVDTVCRVWVGIWVWGWGEDSTCIWVVSTTCCEVLKGIVLNMKSSCIVCTARVESENEITFYLSFLYELVKDLSYIIHRWLLLDWIEAGMSLPHSLSRRGESAEEPSLISR